MLIVSTICGSYFSKNIWSFIEKFAGYGFNKAHSVSYATITYQTAWLKTHHTTEFFAASMTADIDNTDKLIRFKEDCESFKIEINNVNNPSPTVSIKEIKIVKKIIKNI